MVLAAGALDTDTPVVVLAAFADAITYRKAALRKLLRSKK
jgi:hypothetical protein